MDAEILNQLVWIKWLLVMLATIFLIVAGLNVWTIVIRSLVFLKSGAGKPFHKEAGDLIEKGLYLEARTLSETRIRDYPGDAYAFYWHGMACYRLGDLGMALRSLRRAKGLNPGWAVTYVDPQIEAIEAEGGATAKAELRLFTGNPSVSPESPPEGKTPAT